jgi:hypothetical protein
VPVYAGIREWAYAGFTFLLLGAAASHAFMGQGAFIVPLIVLALLIVSYVTRRQLLSHPSV